MKVMILSSHTPSLIWFRLDMMVAFKSLGCEVVAVGNEDGQEWSDLFSKHGIIYRHIFIKRNSINPFNDIKTYRSLKHLIIEEKPDKIFSYNAKAVIYGGLAAKKSGVESFSLIAGLGSILIGKGIKSKLIRKILLFEYKKSLKYSKSIFFQNNDDASFFITKRIVNKEKIVMLNGSGVNLHKFTIQPFPKEFGFLFIGRLLKDKGIMEYLEACRLVKKRYSNVRCMLVGPFDSNPTSLTKRQLKNFIDDGTIEFFGAQEDVRPYLLQCNVLVLPSYHEGTPKVVLEAMASCRAIITTDAPGCRETVIDGLNGFLVPIKDYVKLAEKMVYMFENQNIVKQMAVEGRKRAEDLFDVEKVNEKIISIMNI